MKEFLKRMADALDRFAPVVKSFDFMKSDVFYFDGDNLSFDVIDAFKYIPLEYLIGIDTQKEILYNNTNRFFMGKPSNNALLWGARGCGKSSLVKAVFMKINSENEVEKKEKLCLLEIRKNDLVHLNVILKRLRESKRKFIIFCDDLSFDENDKEIFRYLKTLLDGSLNSMPENVIFYATSNRRHLIKKDEQNTDMDALKIKENTDEGVALSDRFGLWLGFHEIGQDEYLQMVRGYVKLFKVLIDDDELCTKALEWSMTRGSRSGRVAYQFIKSL